MRKNIAEYYYFEKEKSLTFRSGHRNPRKISEKPGPPARSQFTWMSSTRPYLRLKPLLSLWSSSFTPLPNSLNCKKKKKDLVN